MTRRFAASLLLAAAGVLAQARRDHPVADHLFFRCKLLIDPAGGQTIEGAVIETYGGKILRAGQDVPIPQGARVADWSDKYVIPGLVDSHGHLYFGGITAPVPSSPYLGRFYLAAGVTTVVNPGSIDALGDMGVRQRIDDGMRPGPRFFNAGEYLEMNPGPVPWMNPVSTVEEARLKVDRQAAQGASAIKLYASMHGEVMQAAIDQAHLHGLKVLAHLSATSYLQAIQMGVDELYHGAAAMVPFTDGEARSRAVEQLDFDTPEMAETFRLAAQQKVVLTPTLTVFQAGYFRRDRRAVDRMDEQKKYYSAAAWGEIEKGFSTPPKKPWETEKSFRRELQFVARAARAGCLLGTGTDLVIPSMLPGFSLWREMELFAEAGLSPMEILKAATINGAYGVGRSDLLGSVEAGKLADFVALDRNPLESISNVRSVFRVVKAGIVLDPAELLRGMEGAIP